MFEIGKVYTGGEYHRGTRISEHLYLCINRTETKDKYGWPVKRATFRMVYHVPHATESFAKSFRINSVKGTEECHVDFSKLKIATYYITANDVYDGAWFEGTGKVTKPPRQLSEVAQTYGVQVSRVNKVDIITNKYNFISKIEATKWAMKNTRPNQYATLIKMPNKYWENAGRHTRGHLQSVLAYERGQDVGTFRWYNGKPYVVDDMDEYMSPVLESGRLGKKIPSVWSDADKYRKPKKETPIMKRELEL